MTKLDRILDRHRWTIGLTIGALAFALASCHAQAYDVNVGLKPGFVSCSPAGCAWGRLPSGEPRVIHVPQREVSEKSVNEWLDRCHPQVYVDSLGVERYHFAAAGCDFGPR